MSYLARLKRLDSENDFTYIPETVLTKLPKAPSVSSVGSIQWNIGKNLAANDVQNVSQTSCADTFAAQSFPQSIRQSFVPMAADEERAIRTWLGLIEETDPATIAEVMRQCQRDADAREYFIGRAVAALRSSEADDRRTCSQCRNLRHRICTIAKPERGALVVANRGYQPDPARLMRCAGYLPMVGDTDQQSAVTRWPGIGSEPP